MAGQTGRCAHAGLYSGLCTHNNEHAQQQAPFVPVCVQVRVHIPEADVQAMIAFTKAGMTPPENARAVLHFLVTVHEFQATGPNTVDPAVRCANTACAALQPPGVRYLKCSACVTAQDCLRYCSRSCQVAAWTGHKRAYAAAAADAGGELETESHAVATLRRLVTLYLPTARHKMLAGGDTAGTCVLWLNAQCSPCSLTLVSLSDARKILSRKLAANAANETVLARQIAAANAALTAFEAASSAAFLSPLGAAVGHEMAGFEGVHVPAIMSALAVVCLPDATKWQALRLEGARFRHVMTDAECSTHLTALAAEAAEQRAAATGGF